jgi:hypothetical protein
VTSDRRALSFVVLAVALAIGAERAEGAAPPSSDSRALEVADRVLETLGGAEAWSATRYLRFDFAVDREGREVVRRSHTWDKLSGAYRVEAQTAGGDPFIVLMNLNSRQGSAWLKGAAVEGDELKKLLEEAFALWTNDTYWLLMPYKLRDPGVILAYDGLEARDKERWDKVRLSFDGVGLTPKDKYWVYVNRRTGLVDRWEFVLKGESKPRTSFAWDGWKAYGRIQLANERVNSLDGTRVYFPVLEVPDSVPAAVFRSAGPPAR